MCRQTLNNHFAKHFSTNLIYKKVEAFSVKNGRLYKILLNLLAVGKENIFTRLSITSIGLLMASQQNKTVGVNTLARFWVLMVFKIVSGVTTATVVNDIHISYYALKFICICKKRPKKPLFLKAKKQNKTKQKPQWHSPVKTLNNLWVALNRKIW